MSKVSRQWFRFSLRTLLLALTLSCAGIGWANCQLNWIRERHAFLAEAGMGTAPFPISPARLPQALPWSLRLFGEAAIGELMYYPEAPEELVSRARRLFPEARVACVLAD